MKVSFANSKMNRERFRFSSYGWRKLTGYFLALMICIVSPGALIFLTIQAWVEFEGMSFEGKPRNSLFLQIIPICIR